MNAECNLCDASKPLKMLTKAILKVYGIKGWEEQTVLACKECMDGEGLIELKEDKKAA